MFSCASLYSRNSYRRLNVGFTFRCLQIVSSEVNQFWISAVLHYLSNSPLSGRLTRRVTKYLTQLTRSLTETNLVNYEVSSGTHIVIHIYQVSCFHFRYNFLSYFHFTLLSFSFRSTDKVFVFRFPASAKHTMLHDIRQC